MVRDAAIVMASFWLALLLRFDGRPPENFVRSMLIMAPSLSILLLLVGWARGLYGGIPRYASLRDLSRLSGVVGITAVCLLGVSEVYFKLYLLRPLPLSVTVMGSLLMFFGLGAVRIARRLAVNLRQRKAGSPDAKRVLIVGAGDAGEHVARDMLRSGSGFIPAGFLDDDPAKIGKKIHGLTVHGPADKVAEAVAATAADHLLVAMPSAPSDVIQRLLKRLEIPGLKVKILPSLGELMGAAPTAADIRDVDISDLIARSQVTVDPKQIAEMVAGRVVLITGAAGSIGSQLARQSLAFGPGKLILLDNNETDLYEMFLELEHSAQASGVCLEMVIADIRDRQRIDTVFEQHRPALVFHAAAYKHVPVMELHPEEAVITNVTGTRHVAEAASLHNAERFILVSTDKAVNPTTTMGAAKRLAEIVIGATASQSDTVFASVRFGNVLASRGSVVQIFQRQIKAGGPITVTHPEATRYFMTIEEAVSLICQAGALAKGGETFVLEMGEPVRILDLAERMRALLADSGAEKIEIIETGLRPGEKLHEDLWMEDETYVAVRPGILQTAGSGQPCDETVLSAIRELEEMAAKRLHPSTINEALFAIVDLSRNGSVSVP
jgi:FlaA1/EpsC-like NDP-sugar epimerase